MITVTSLVLGLLFIPTIIYSYPLAIFVLVFHCLLDGLDGPLATYQKKASNQGMLLDFTADLVGISSVIIGLAITGYMDAILASVFLALNTTILFYSLIQTIMGVKQTFGFKPRWWIYGAVIGLYVVESVTHIKINVIPAFTLLSCAVMVVCGTFDFLRIYRHANL